MAEFKRRFRGRKYKEVGFVDYKDVGQLRRYMSQHGKIYSRKRNSVTPKDQRTIAYAIKRARFMGLLSYKA